MTNNVIFKKNRELRKALFVYIQRVTMCHAWHGNCYNIDIMNNHENKFLVKITGKKLEVLNV